MIFWHLYPSGKPESVEGEGTQSQVCGTEADSFSFTSCVPTKNVSLKQKDWNKRTIKEWIAACDIKKARSIAAGNREYAKLIEGRWQAAEDNSAGRTSFPDTAGEVTQTEGEPSSSDQGAMGPVRVKEEEPMEGNATGSPPAEDDDSLDKGVLDEGGQLMPIDDLASPEDEFLLEFECAP